ncbi:MAG: metal-dependent transcriptional regulator [Cellulosilyticum sp.]|nr:metal-dependent transcriptional regulator [Cellulosilyticum sp.]MEE1073158.1 metal-dependent transcriptional regulator [Cellulosilyticum sp.]
MLGESGENYLETILFLKKEKGFVRSIDIAMRTGFSKPSVSRAVGILKQNGYIRVEDSGEIIFTEQGEKKAIAIYEKHHILTQFFQKVACVSAEIAEEDACKIEHIISNETFEGIKKYMEINK